MVLFGGPLVLKTWGSYHPEMTQEKEPASENQTASCRVLVVDNDKSHAAAMAETLERVGYNCTVATSGPDGAANIEQGDFDIVITDLVMPEIDGDEILRRAKETLPNCEVIVVTGHASVPKAVEAMQQGAFNFLEKPLNTDRLRAVTEKAADAVRLRQQNLNLMQRLDERFGFEGIIYSSEQMNRVIERVKRLAPTDASVLITGDTGTGKELVAQAIHQNSPRRKKPFVALNGAAINEHLLESELFGHVRGAYTDAREDRVGKFEFANGGTLFLDEIGDMPMATQIKLLRVLESGEIIPVGQNKPISVNVRILSATHRDLAELIHEGTFRQDLYHRLKVVTIHLPALCERRDDIIPLADHFRKTFAKKHHKIVRGITPAASRKLISGDWKGNVRQLRNAIEHMVVMDNDEVLDVDDFLELESSDQRSTVEAVETGMSELVGKSFSEIEKWAITETLKLTGGNRKEAAEILGVGERTLYRKIRDYDL